MSNRLKGLFDEARPGRPRSISDDQVEKVIIKTLEEKPVAPTHWSSRWMAAATGMCQSSIVSSGGLSVCSRWRAESFKLSTDPLFMDKVYDVCGLYLDPPERAVSFVLMRSRRSKPSTGLSRSCR